jgi:hypothetical protein
MRKPAARNRYPVSFKRGGDVWHVLHGTPYLRANIGIADAAEQVKKISNTTSTKMLLVKKAPFKENGSLTAHSSFRN